MNHTTAALPAFLQPFADRTYFVLWSIVVANGAFWGANIFFALLDHFGLFASYKVKIQHQILWELGAPEFAHVHFLENS